MLSNSKVLLSVLLPWYLCPITWASTVEQQIVGVIDELCPRNNVCTANKKSQAKAIFPGWKPCCTECSCSPSCSGNGNCCFPTAESREYHRGQTCISTWIPIPKAEEQFLFSSYYMYTTPPTDGCVTDAGNTVMKTQAKRWSNLLPVYSKSSAKIYLNKHVAECHGEYHFTQWRVFATCRRRDGTTGNNFDMMVNDDSIFNFTNESHCKFHFRFPRDTNIIESERCYPELVDSCGQEPFQVPSGINMSQDDIRLACQISLLSPYTQQANFANVFCYICSGKPFSENSVCSDFDRSRTDIYAIDILLNPDVLGDMHSTTKKTNAVTRKLACPTTMSLPDECRDVLCPKGRLRAENGTCVWLYQALMTDHVGLFLKLAPNTPLPVDRIRPNDMHEFPQWLTSPWSNKWLSYTIHCEYTDDTKSQIKHFWVDQMIRWRGKRMETLIESIKTTMKSPWTALIGSRTITLEQIIDVNRDFQVSQNTYFFTGSGRKVLTEHSIIHTLFRSTIRPQSRHYITYPYLCDLVEVFDGEFTTTHIEEAITCVSTNKTLNTAEYALRRRDNGPYKVMVCLEDSVFVHVSGCPGQMDQYNSVVAAFSITWLLTHYSVAFF